MAYAEAVHAGLGPRAPGTSFEAWLVHLERGSLEAVTVTTAARERSQTVRRASVAQLVSMHERAILIDQPVGETFKRPADPNTTCRTCRLLEVCLPELARRTESAAS